MPGPCTPPLRALLYLIHGPSTLARPSWPRPAHKDPDAQGAVGSHAHSWSGEAGDLAPDPDTLLPCQAHDTSCLGHD